MTALLSLRLETASDTIDLAGIEHDGYGVQFTAGATGFGLAPADIFDVQGAGDGGMYRGQRFLPRDNDYPVYILGRDRDELKQLVSRLATALSGPCRLVYSDGRLDDATEEWYQDVVRVGGGSWVYGQDTNGEKDLSFVVTLRAYDPLYTSTFEQLREIDAAPPRGMLTSSLTKLRLSAHQGIGEIDLDNTAGDAKSFPTWTVYGPGNEFQAVSPTGEVLQWNGTLTAGQWLKIDTRTSTVVDHTGANRYADLAPRPQFWAIPPGVSTAVATILNAVPGQTKIACAWRPRKLVVI